MGRKPWHIGDVVLEKKMAICQGSSPRFREFTDACVSHLFAEGSLKAGWPASLLRHLSTAMATAFPPPRHRAAIPRCTSRRIIS